MNPARKTITLLLLFLLTLTAVSCSSDPDPAPPPADPTEPPTAESATVEPAPTDTAEPEPDPTNTAIPPTATPEPQIIDLNTTLNPAPRLIGRSPEPGQELLLDGSLELYFDQPMNLEATTNALRVIDTAGNLINGEITWPQPRILRFKPAVQLTPDQSYEAVLDETAASEQGESLTEGLTFTFQTIGNLEISQVSPVDLATEVQGDTAVTVIFNRPVVPLLTLEEQLDLPNPLVIDPPIVGRGEWVNTSVFIFRPDEPLIGRQTYTARVLADVVNEASATGSVLAADYQWSFTITAPTINRLALPGRESYPRDNYQNLPLNQDFEIYFNQPMTRITTQVATTLASESGQVPLEFAWNENNTRLAITPTVDLDLATRYVLTVADTATSAEGGRLRAPLIWNATTSLPPAITNTEPVDGQTQNNFRSYFRIVFASRMDRDSLDGKVIFDPPLETGETSGYYSPWEWSLTYYGLQPSTTYTVTILPGMSDPHGNLITEERTVTFTTAAYNSFATLEMSGVLALYRQGGSTAIWTSHRNVDQMTVDLYSIRLNHFHAIVNGRNTSDNDFNTSNSVQIWSNTITPDNPLNQRGYTRLDLLDDSGNQLPPGFYYTTLNSPDVEYRSRHLNGRTILLANANITLKTTLTEAMIWVTDLTTGEPVADVPVTFYSENFLEVFSGTTDADGLIYQDGLELAESFDTRYYAIADGNGYFGAAFNGWTDGTNPRQFNIFTDYYERPGEVQTYIYTDRPLYRTGQTVDIKGIIRFNDDLNYALPEFDTVNVRISSYDGMVYDEDVPVSEYGSFLATVQLDDEATLGGYFIDVRTQRDGGEYVGGGSFEVAEFRKPTYQVNVTAAESDLAIGDELVTTVDAEYFSGGAVVEGDLFWNVSSAPFTFFPSSNLRSYNFTSYEFDRYYYFSPNQNRFGSTIANGQGQTNTMGGFEIRLPAEVDEEEAGSRRFTIEATVNDVAGNAVSGRTQVIVHQSEFYTGIKSSQRIGTVDEEVGFEVVLVDWDSNVIPNGTVSVEIVKRIWSSVQEEDEFGNTIWRSEVEEIPAADFEAVQLDENGRATVTFTPESGGIYRAYARATDSGGNEAVSSAYVWVAGSSYIPWRRSSDHGFDLIADSDTYAPGDTAEILIASPFQGESYALVTTERGHIYSSEVIRLTSNSTIYRLPITGDMAPNIFVSVMIMKGVDEFNSAPDFKLGMLRFSVEREEQELNIEITPSEELLGPQETVEYTVRVTDHTGTPVQAELSASLVDLALLSLKEDNARPILDFFYSNRWLSVQTAVLLTRNMDAYNEELQEEIKGGGGGGGFGFGVFEIREDFKDTAYWEGQLVTDENGVATFEVTLPDNLTTWRLDVRAVTKDTLVAQATNDIRTTRPLLVSPQTPRFFIRGDQAQVGTVVRNTTNQELEAVVTMEAEGVTTADSETQTVTVPANNSVFVTWNITVDEVDRVDFVFYVNSGEFSDAARPEIATLEGGGIPVYRYEVPETVGTSGQMLDGGVLVESIGLPVFEGFEFSEGDIEVEISPSLVAAMTDGFDYLQHYPYECTEQIVSKFLPNVITTRAMQEAGISNPELEADLDTQVNVALQRLYSRQNADGGWPWWNSNRSNTLVSAYVVLGLAEAERAGYPIEHRSLSQGALYIFDNLSSVDELDGRFKFNRQAFIIYVLAELDLDFRLAQPIDELFENRESLDLYARAYLAQAMINFNPDDPRIDTLIGDLISSASISATGTHWDETQRDYWNWNSDTRTTGIILSLLAKQETDNPLTVQTVRWLMANRDSGYWRSTQDTAWVLMGLTDWMVESGELEADYAYEVALNGNLLGQAEANADTLRTPLEIQADVTELLTDGLNRLAIGRTDGPGNLYYTAHLNTYLPASEVDAVSKGIIISRDYFHPINREEPITAVEQGQTVVVRLTIVIPDSVHYVVIDDPLPAGLEAIDLSLRTSEVGGAPDRYIVEQGDFRSNGWGWWYFDHVELRDEKVVISADFMPAGTYEYVYLARASTIGQFNTIPPTAFEFYFPEVYGRGAGMVFEVAPQGTLPEVLPPPEDTAEEVAEDAAEAAAETPAEEDVSLIGEEEIGQSVNGEPITAIRIGTGDIPLVFVGGIHAGFAPASVTLAETLAAELQMIPDIVPSNVSVYIIPNLNPDSLPAAGQLDGRLNANGVDLNRNWDCRWTADPSILGQTVAGGGGSAPLSESETAALAEWLLDLQPEAVVIWQARAADGLVSAGGCDGTPAVSAPLAERYAEATGYVLVDYEQVQAPVNGDITNWLDAQGIPAVSVLLKEYDDPDLGANRDALSALFELYEASGGVTRIQFEEGGTSTAIVDQIAPNQDNTYLVSVAADQSMIVSLSGDDLPPSLSLQITGVDDGAFLLTDNQAQTRWYGTVPTTQDYRLQVQGAAPEGTEYSLFVAVPERVAFVPGSVSGTVSGEVAQGETDYYILNAAEGQTISVMATADEELYFTVTDFEDDNLLIDSIISPNGTWSADLPATQEYLILIGSPSGSIPYTLDIQIE